MEYQEYLKGERWHTLSELAKVFANKKCQLCNSTDKIQTHHRTYDNIKTEMEFFDLIVICRACHEKYHIEMPEEYNELKETLDKKKFHWFKMLVGADDVLGNRINVLFGYIDDNNIEEVERLEKSLTLSFINKHRH